MTRPGEGATAMEGFLEAVAEVDVVVDMEEEMRGGPAVDMEEDLRIEVVVVGMMMIGVVVALHFVIAEAVTGVAGKGWSSAVSFVDATYQLESKADLEFMYVSLWVDTYGLKSEFGKSVHDLVRDS